MLCHPPLWTECALWPFLFTQCVLWPWNQAPYICTGGHWPSILYFQFKALEEQRRSRGGGGQGHDSRYNINYIITIVLLISILLGRPKVSLDARGRGCRGAMIPAKMISGTSGFAGITSRPRKTGLPASVTSPSFPPFCLHAPHFGLRLMFLFFV